MMPIEIATARLRLYAPSLVEVEALTRGERASVSARLGAAASEEWWQGPSLLRLLPHLPETMRATSGEARWVWIVIEPPGPQQGARVIGDVGFHHPITAATTSAEIGYNVIPQARGRGYTTEAVAALIQAAFAHTGVTQVIAQIEPGNAASLRVAAKLGMRELPPVSEGYRRFGVSPRQAP